jgi:hypothetical protein
LMLLLQNIQTYYANYNVMIDNVQRMDIMILN